MRKNGFTLIELLAVIVILAIIALIATPIILGIINDAREKANERSVELYASAVRNGIAAYQLREGKEVLPGTYNETKPLPFEPEYDGQVDCTSVIISEEGKVSLDKCTVNGGTKEYSYGIEENTVAKVCSIERQDASKYSVGDVVTCNIGETPDKFYVIEDAELSATTIQMLTEKNIHTTEYRQSDDAGSVAFSSTNYWSSYDEYIDEWSLLPEYGSMNVYNNNSLLFPIVEGYVLYLNTKLAGATGTLLTYSQVNNLGCDDVVCSNLSWAFSMDYWTSSAGDNFSLYVVGSVGIGMPSYDGNNGVRPVITISTSEIE